MSKTPDESQREAIYAPFVQSVLVTAPPGYGKTFVMPRRIEYLIKSGNLLPPARALGLTFTNAAASEMLSRLERRVSPRSLEYVDAMTFHSFCYRVLRAYGNYIDLVRDFRILPEQEKQQIFERFAQEREGNSNRNLWDGYDNWERAHILKLEQKPDEGNPLFTQFWETHKAQQIDKNELDFNHLLWFTYKLFLSHPEILEVYRQAYRYILVDEFQDTNPIQFFILRLLVRGHEVYAGPKMPACPVFIFADDWQSIYGFLGAVPKQQIQQAKELFHCTEVELTQDHRTDSPALSLFGRVLRQATHQASSSPGLDIPLTILSDPYEMARAVDMQVSEWADSGIPLHEMAILGRARWQLTSVQEALSHKFLSVPDLQANGLERNLVFSILTSLVKNQAISYGSLQRILKQRSENSKLTEGEAYVRTTLIDLAGNYDLRYPKTRLGDKAKAMANEALLEINWGHQIRQLCKDRIFVGSLHSAKGLEFRAVAIVHLDQDSFPLWRYVCQFCKEGAGLQDQLRMREQLEEEWRVFYVGVTRAREHLALFSSAQSIDRFGRAHSTPVTCLVAPPIWNYLAILDYRDKRGQTTDIRCLLRDDVK